MKKQSNQKGGVQTTRRLLRTPSVKTTQKPRKTERACLFAAEQNDNQKETVTL